MSSLTDTTYEAYVTTISKKVCLIGDFAVGKTSLVRRMVYQRFDERYLSTIGTQVTRKVVALDSSNELVILLWDIAGSNGYETVHTSYLRGAAGAVLVADLTRPETIDHLVFYRDLLHSVAPLAQVVVAANKLDLVDADPGDLSRQTAQRAGIQAPIVLTSAKNGAEVERLFGLLAALLVDRCA